MLDNLKLSHKVVILPAIAALGFIHVLMVFVTGSSRSQSIRESLHDDEVRAIVTAQNSAAWEDFAAEIGRNVSEAATGSSEIARNVAGVASAAQSTSSGAGTTLQSAVQLGQTADDLEATLAHFTFAPTEED